MFPLRTNSYTVWVEISSLFREGCRVEKLNLRVDKSWGTSKSFLYDSLSNITMLWNKPRVWDSWYHLLLLIKSASALNSTRAIAWTLVSTLPDSHSCFILLVLKQTSVFLWCTSEKLVENMKVPFWCILTHNSGLIEQETQLINSYSLQVKLRDLKHLYVVDKKSWSKPKTGNVSQEKLTHKPIITFSNKKLEILPPSGCPPLVNWISTYLP